MLGPTEVTLPETIYEQVFESNCQRSQPDTQSILIDAYNTDRALSFEDLKKRTRALAFALRSAPYSFNEGDIVAICSPNDIEYVVAFHGILAAGCAACLVPEILTTQETVGIFGIAEPRAVIAHADTLDMVVAAMHAYGHQIPIWVVGDATDSKFTPLSDLYMDAPTTARLPKVNPDTPAFFVCTSGTTGPRKLVTITQRIAALRAQDSVRYFPGKSADERMIASNHYAYAYSVAITMITLVQLGIQQYVVGAVELPELLRLLERHRITQISFSPWAVAHIAHHPEVLNGFDLSSLKLASSGGQAIRSDVQRLVRKHLNLRAFTVFYGSTEAFSPFMSIEDEPREASGKVRREKGYHTKLVDEHGEEVPLGNEGELWVKHPLLAKGYFKDPIKTVAVFDKDGYYHTNDIFKMNDRDELYFLGRKSDTIKTRYRYFSPRYIEDVIMSYDGIKECAVVGAFSTKHCFEYPRAYIVLRDKKGFAEFSPDAFLAYVNKRVPEEPMQLQGGVEVLEELPRTPVKKVDLFSLRALAQQAIEQRNE